MHVSISESGVKPVVIERLRRKFPGDAASQRVADAIADDIERHADDVSPVFVSVSVSVNYTAKSNLY